MCWHSPPNSRTPYLHRAAVRHHTASITPQPCTCRNAGTSIAILCLPRVMMVVASQAGLRPQSKLSLPPCLHTRRRRIRGRMSHSQRTDPFESSFARNPASLLDHGCVSAYTRRPNAGQAGYWDCQGLPATTRPTSASALGHRMTLTMLLQRTSLAGDLRLRWGAASHDLLRTIPACLICLTRSAKFTSTSRPFPLRPSRSFRPRLDCLKPLPCSAMVKLTRLAYR